MIYIKYYIEKAAIKALETLAKNIKDGTENLEW